MRANYSDERRATIGNLNLGKKLSDETRALLRAAAQKRKPMSLESRLKCAVNVRPVLVTNLDGSNPQKFSSIINAAKALNCNEKTIRRALKGNKKFKKIYLVTDVLKT